MIKYSTYSDNELIRLLKAGDESVFIEIYNRYWKSMLGVAYNRLGNLEEAEECVQDVMYKLWRLRADLNLRQDGLAGYLAIATRNHTFNVLDKRYRERTKMTAYPGMEDTGVLSPERQLIIKELEQKIDRLLKTLPAQCRLIFTMNKLDGLTTKQIATTLNLSENTVKAHLKRAKKTIGCNPDKFTIL